MVVNLHWTAVWPAMLGAAFQELLYWYQLRGQLTSAQNQVLLRSPIYWAITCAMIVASGFGTAIFYGDRVKAIDGLCILGAAFPLIFKKLVNAAPEHSLGDWNPARTYFHAG